LSVVDLSELDLLAPLLLLLLLDLADSLLTLELSLLGLETLADVEALETVGALLYESDFESLAAVSTDFSPSLTTLLTWSMNCCRTSFT
jgi:hypothetical protein